MKLSSPAFQEGELIPKKYAKDKNPPLLFEEIPKGAQTLALIMDDPDVPPEVCKEKIWDHWVVFNIAPEIREIGEDCGPFAMMGQNSSGKNAYEGPCPPDRTHRYFFTLYALDKELDLEEGISKSILLDAMEGHIIEEAQLMGRFERVDK